MGPPWRGTSEKFFGFSIAYAINLLIPHLLSGECSDQLTEFCLSRLQHSEVMHGLRNHFATKNDRLNKGFVFGYLGQLWNILVYMLEGEVPSINKPQRRIWVTSSMYSSSCSFSVKTFMANSCSRRFPKLIKSNQITFIGLVSSENYYRRPRIITSIT